MRHKLLLLGLIALALMVPACNRTLLNIETNFDLDPGLSKFITADPVGHAQKIKVDVTSEAVPVSVFVFLEKDKTAAVSDIEARKPAPAGVLAKEEKTKKATIEVMIPADSAAVVMVTRASKLTHVVVKLTN